MNYKNILYAAIAATSLYLSGCSQQDKNDKPSFAERTCEQGIDYECSRMTIICADAKTKFASTEGCLEIAVSCLKVGDTCKK